MERLMKATTENLKPEAIAERVLVAVLNKGNAGDVRIDLIASENSGRVLRVFFTVCRDRYQFVVDTDLDYIEFGVSTDCRYMPIKFYITPKEASKVFNIISEAYAIGELKKLFNYFYNNKGETK